MESFQYLLHGFTIALQPTYLFYCFAGVLGGTLVGVLPAIGPVAAVALLLPATYHLNPIGAVIMLAGIYYGAMYGGSTTSILINVPGEASSVVTCFDGYPMAMQGRAGPALGMAAFSSFIAGTLSIVGLMLFAPVLGRAALSFSSPEYFALMAMSLTLVTYMARRSMVKALMMVAWGLILSTVGMDVFTSNLRLTYNLLYLRDGIHIIPLIIGLFGLSEVINNFQTTFKGEVLKTRIKGFFPTAQDWKDSLFPILRCGTLGFLMGILPGVSPLVPTFISYGIERKLSKHPEKFGTGVIEGVAGPEACNNAAVCGTQIPLFSLGIPTNVMNTMLLAALMIWGMTPGPQFIRNSPDLFWGLVASMYLGNVMLLVLNLPLIPLWVRVLKIPHILLSIFILIFCIIGAYTTNQQVEDIYLLVICGLIGFLGKQFDYELAPLILAFVLGPKIEISLRQSLIMSHGSFAIFFTRPITAVFMAIALFIIITAIIGIRKSGTKEAEKAEGFMQKGIADRIVSIFGILFALYIAQEGFGIGVGLFHRPGPGSFLLVGAVLLFICSVILLFQIVQAKSKVLGRKSPSEEKGSPRRVVFLFAALFCFALIFEWLGFILSTFLLVLFLIRLLEDKTWWNTVLTATIVSLTAYTIFNVLLKSGLPEGILEAFF